jgi:hypothetical protein
MEDLRKRAMENVEVPAADVTGGSAVQREPSPQSVNAAQ